MVLSGNLLTLGSLRHTPAGVPVIEFSIAHRSRQEEAGGVRQVECEMACVALGSPAGIVRAAGMNARLTVTGFLAAKSVKSRVPVLHVNTVEFDEGN